MARSPVIAVLVGTLMAPLSFMLMLLFPPVWVGLVMPVVAAGLGVGLLWSRLPPLAKEALVAEEEDGVLVLMHGDDHRVVPIAGYYWKKGNVVEPVSSRFKNFKFVPDPGSTVPVTGQKSKLALAYVNYPFLLNPNYILAAYDYKRLGFQNLGQLIEYTKHYKNVEELEQELERWRRVQKLAESARSVEDLPENVRSEAGLETDEDLAVWREQVRRYVQDLEALVEMVKKKRVKPIVKIGTRFYSANDMLGYLGFTTRPSKLASMIDTARLEERQRLTKEWAQAMKYGLVVFMGVIGLIMLIIVLNWLGHPVTVQQVPIPVNATG